MIVVTFLTLKTEAQVDHELFRTILTDIADRDEEQDLDQLPELLEELSNNPVYINQADHEELARLFWLTDFQVKSLLDHVKKAGAILSYYEIAYLYGFTPELAQSLQPFISLEKRQEITKIKPERVIRYGRHKLITGMQTVLQKQEGYTRPDSIENKYSGSPAKIYLKYVFKYADKVHFGFTAEKDPGESFFRKNNPYGFDFYSGHLQVNTNGLLKSLTLGDFRTDFGQGLVLWSGLNYGKSAMTLNTMRYNERLRRYGSAGENRFFRGIGSTFRLRPFHLTIFYSRKAIDATVSEESEDGKILSVSTHVNTGYHRTPNEIAQKDAIKEQVTGANISLTRPDWHIGATATHYRFEVPLIPNSYIYNYFAFKGRSGSNYSIDFRVHLGDIIVYGEQALCPNGAYGLLYGAQMLVSEHLTANILYRYYAKDFHALYGNAPGENTRNNNEEGFFMGWNWNPGGRWRFSSYVDIFRFPWLQYRAYSPSYGRDILLQADYTPVRDTRIYIQAKYKEKEENQQESTVNRTISVRTMSVKMMFSHQLNEHIRIGNHWEIKNYRKDNTLSNGYFLAQDIQVKLFNNFPLQITARYAIFDSGDYNARIYSYENDMLHAFSIPAFYDQGTRLYMLVKYSFGEHIDFRIKYAITQYTDKKTIGSGLNMIQGNRYSELKLQAVCKF
ncbi:MAG: helix-hairpin-helix domain-containing protein [Bacteroidales bacterium]|jgi:hypothetical protein|nr:helix-hairpin-helix domain-containing protein [Bacteroidales bacterium]